MTRDAATVAVALALLAGFYWARLLRANEDLRKARAGVDTAAKAAWRARWVILGTGFAVLAAVDMWLRGKGR